MGRLITFDMAQNGDDPSCVVARTLGPAPFGGTRGVVDQVVVYRFGDRGKGYDWQSPRRQRDGTFQRPGNSQLNALALSQVRFGRKGDVGPDTPFVSVATSYQRLYTNGEPWVQDILGKVPDLGVFVVPFACLMRPSINSHATKVETEWLYYDGDREITHYLREWRANPYKA